MSSLSSPKGGEGQGEEAFSSRNKTPRMEVDASGNPLSPALSPLSRGEREKIMRLCALTRKLESNSSNSEKDVGNDKA